MENLRFTYDKEKDVACLLDWGKGSNNSTTATSQYNQLIAQYGANPTTLDVEEFVDVYMDEQQINHTQCALRFQHEWNAIAGEYHKRAQQIFGVALPKKITAYLTVNSRCPYNIHEGYFLVAMSARSANVIAMHELWHFYTWYGLGVGEEERIGRAKHNELKESLTVILNEECGDLYPKGMADLGYPQHAQIREEIRELWRANKDIKTLWYHFAPV